MRRYFVVPAFSPQTIMDVVDLLILQGCNLLCRMPNPNLLTTKMVYFKHLCNI